MKLIIQITCYNEGATLPLTIRDLPRTIEGFDQVEYLVVDDGSVDITVQVAKELGVQHILRLPVHKGLAAAFLEGLTQALRLGADVIVHTDGDNQYRGEDIAILVQPVLQNKADIVIGDRGVKTIPHFSILKRFLQRLGSRVVQFTAGTQVPDATSGFRAFSRMAALRFNVFTGRTYTLETLIQAGRKGMVIVSVPIRTNSPTRESRLIRSTFGFVVSQGFTILRLFCIYAPLRFFGTLALSSLAFGILLGIRFLVFFYSGQGQGHVQSLILASIFMTFGFQLAALALLAELISVNRKLLEDMQYQLRTERYLKPDTGA